MPGRGTARKGGEPYVARIVPTLTRRCATFGTVVGGADDGRSDIIPPFAEVDERDEAQAGALVNRKRTAKRHIPGSTRDAVRKGGVARIYGGPLAASVRRRQRGSAPQLDGRAAIHHDGESALGRDARGLPVDHAELEPQRLRADRDGLAGGLLGQLGAAEDVDDVDRAGRGCLGQRRHGRDAQDLRLVGVHGHAVVPGVHEGPEHAM